MELNIEELKIVTAGLNALEHNARSDEPSYGNDPRTFELAAKVLREVQAHCQHSFGTAKGYERCWKCGLSKA